MAVDKLKNHLESIGRDYRILTGRPSFQYYLKRRKEHLVKLCDGVITAESVILDLGSGNGNYLEVLKDYRYILSLDLSFNALKAHELPPDKVFRLNADVQYLPLQSDSVDVVFLFGLLHHLPDSLSLVFSELSRVLKKGGMVIIDEPNGYNPIWAVYMRIHEIDRVGTRPLFPATLRKNAVRNGLKVQSELFWGLVPPVPENRIAIKFFAGIGEWVEKTFLARICTRFSLVLKKKE